MKRFLFNGRLFFSMEDLHCDINYQNFKHALYTRLDIVVLTIRLLYIFCTYNPFTLYFKFPGEEAHILKEATWHAWSTNWKPKAPYILLWLNNYIEPLDQRVFFLSIITRKPKVNQLWCASEPPKARYHLKDTQNGSCLPLWKALNYCYKIWISPSRKEKRK